MSGAKVEIYMISSKLFAFARLAKQNYLEDTSIICIFAKKKKDGNSICE